MHGITVGDGLVLQHTAQPPGGLRLVPGILEAGARLHLDETQQSQAADCRATAVQQHMHCHKEACVLWTFVRFYFTSSQAEDAAPVPSASMPAAC